MKPSVKLSFFIILTIAACKDSVKHTETNELPIKLSKVNEVNFELDERSVQDSKHFSVYEFDGESYLAFFNKPDNSIKVYSIDTRKKFQSIKLQTYGPNALIAIDSSPDNFYFKSPDSIYIYSSVQQKVCLIDSLANVMECQKILSQRDDPKLPSYLINTLNPLRYLNGAFHFIGNISWYDDGQPPIAVLNWNGLQKQLPENLQLYANFNRSEIGTSEFFKASNAQLDHQTLLISYPMDHRIMRITNGNIEYIELRNKKLGELEPFGKVINMETMRSQEYFDFTTVSGRYHAILTDPKKKLIYRVARLPSTMELLRRVRENGEPRNWDFSIMIYDYDFKLQGELTLKNKLELDFNTMFIYNSSLFIRKTNDNENLLSFAIYETSLRD